MIMSNLFDNISIVGFALAIILAIASLCLNIYFFKRYNFQIKVNCWFCNKNSYTSSKYRNKFTCQYCGQYNGFDKEGNYNKVIPAQHINGLNNTNYSVKNGNNKQASLLTSSPRISAVLCDRCNRNQELKVKQLAEYEPLNPEQFDTEIEHFEKQLEKTYGLCKNCKILVKKTVRDQDKWLFGKSLKNKFAKYFEPNNQETILVTIKRFYFFFNVILLVLSLLSVLIFSRDLFPSYFLENLLKLKTDIFSSKLYTDMSRLVLDLRLTNSYIHLPHKISVNMLVNLLGLCFELIFSLLASKYSWSIKLSKLIGWLALSVISYSKLSTGQSVHIQIFTLYLLSGLWLLCSYSSALLKLPQNEHPTRQSKKFINNRRIYFTDDDNDDDDDNRSESTRNIYNNDSQTTTRNNSPGFESSSFSERPNNVNNELNNDFDRLNIIEAESSLRHNSQQKKCSNNPFSSSPTSSSSLTSPPNRFASMNNFHYSHYSYNEQPTNLSQKRLYTNGSYAQRIVLPSSNILNSRCREQSTQTILEYLVYPAQNFYTSVENNSPPSPPPSVVGSNKSKNSKINFVLQ